MYGAGAHAAGLLAIHVRADPVAGLATGAPLAVVSGLILMRTQGLTLIMPTLAIAATCLEVTDKARDLTGGADGLRGSGIQPAPGI